MFDDRFQRHDADGKGVGLWRHDLDHEIGLLRRRAAGQRHRHQRRQNGRGDTRSLDGPIS
jgi:hypothetical protein